MLFINNLVNFWHYSKMLELVIFSLLNMFWKQSSSKEQSHVYSSDPPTSSFLLREVASHPWASRRDDGDAQVAVGRPRSVRPHQRRHREGLDVFLAQAKVLTLAFFEGLLSTEVALMLPTQEPQVRIPAHYCLVCNLIEPNHWKYQTSNWFSGYV